MTLSEYAELVLTCSSYEVDIQGYTNSCNELTKDIEKLQRERDIKLNSITVDRSSFIREEIERRTYEATQEIKKQISDLDFSLNHLNAEKFVAVSTALDMYADYIDLCNKMRKEIKRHMVSSKSLLKIVKEPSSSSIKKKSVSQIADELQEGLSVLELMNVDTRSEENDTINVSDKVALVTNQIDSSNRIYFLLLVGVIAGGSIVVNPLIVSAPFAIYLGHLYRRYSKSTRESLEALGNLKYYNSLTVQLESSIQKRVKLSEDKAKEKFEKDLMERKNKVSSELKTLRSNLFDIQQEIHTSSIKEFEQDNFEETQRAQILSQYAEKISAIKERLEGIQEELDSKKEEFYNLSEQRDSAKKELEEQYFGLTKCGTDKILPEMFLLGMDGYEPITIRMLDYCAHVVSTVKNSTDIFTSFVKMCVSQILCTTNSSCVHIYLVDIENGTGRFGIFGSLNELGIIEVIKTSDELKDLIDKLYDIKSHRDQTITVEEDTLNKYNERMIANYGLTEPYHILITTHPVMELLKNEKYIQLLKSGNMGIVTISLWDKRIFEIQESDNKDMCRSKLLFLQSILKSCESTEDGTSNLASISKNGIIVQMKRQEIDAKYLSLGRQASQKR